MLEMLKGTLISLALLAVLACLCFVSGCQENTYVTEEKTHATTVQPADGGPIDTTVTTEKKIIVNKKQE